MKLSKSTILFLVGVFVAGMVFALVGAKLIMSKKDFLIRVRDRIEKFRIARIPRKAEELRLYDFENYKEVEQIFFNNSAGALSDEQFTSGKKSLKAVFSKTSGASGVVLKKIFDKDKQASNWEGYDSFAMDIYNPSDENLRVILKIKDTKGYQYQEDLHLRPKRWNEIRVSVSSVRPKIKPAHINQVNVFFWNLKKPETLYFDNIKLMPERFLGKDGLVILQDEYQPKDGEPIYEGGEFFNFNANRGRWTNGIPLYVNNPTTAFLPQVPVKGGIPFPRGEIKDTENIRLFNKNKEPLAVQSRALGFWPDGSVKWAEVITKMDLVPLKKTAYTMFYTLEGKPQKQESRLKVKESRGSVEVDTGAVKFEVKKDGFRLFDRVWVDHDANGKYSRGEEISSSGDMVVVRDGQEYRSSLDKDVQLSVEQQGPLSAVIKAEGWFVSKKKEKYCKFVVRMRVYEGDDAVRVSHTLIYTGYPENKYHYLYKGKRLPKNEMIDAFYLETPYQVGGQKRYSFGADEKSLTAALKNDVEIKQENDGVFSVESGKDQSFKGKHSEGWVDVSGDDHGFSVVVQNLWQQYPKGFRVDHKEKMLRTDLWPLWAGPLDLKTEAQAYGPDAVARGSAFGLGKTHEINFYFHSGALSKEVGWNKQKLLAKTLVLSAVPHWVYDTVALGKLAPVNQKANNPGEEAFQSMFDWAKRQVENYHWYGMINFGDTLSIYKDGGWNPAGRHGWFNKEAMGTSPGCFMQYLRTGDYSFFEYGENNIRHVMDVDTVHYNTVDEDKRLKKHIPNDYSQPGSMHRHNFNHWGGRNEETSHTNLHGILLYHYLTGNERALDVAKEVGEFFLKERITYFRHPDIAPQRSLANLLWGAVDMYQATLDERYKKLADKYADILYRGLKYDGIWPENYNPENKVWYGKEHTLYTLNYTLPALVKYHQMTGNKAIAEAIVAGTEHYVEANPYNPLYEAKIYAYYLSGDARFLESARTRLKYHAGHQRKGGDPLTEGMIYQKPFYQRAVEFLYQFPYAAELNRVK